ncbi:MAG: flagellar hook-basal body protein [Dethiobacteraceae bacterium]|jgi:flagellar basal-body rod protein FlgG|nr:flagellar hook-basal body protein [Bacillota bacterium]
MLRGIKNAASALRGQQMKVDVTAHNLANINTTGYKKQELLFQDLLYQQVARRGNAVMAVGAEAKPVVTGVGTAMATVRRDVRAGAYLETNRELDLAIVGDGYFRVTLPDGSEAYTRAGNLQKDSSGNLVTAQGYRLQFPQLPAAAAELQISEDGMLTVVTTAGEKLTLGQIQLAYFDNPAGLVQLGQNLYAAGPNSGAARIAPPGPETRLKQGYLESANVDLAQEMTGMLLSQRAFSLNARVLQTFAEMLDIANNLRR